MLAGTSTTFDQWVALNVTATTGPAGRGELAHRLAAGLRLAPADARAVVDQLIGGGLLTGGAGLTDTGQARFAEISAGIAGITQRLYAGLPADDLETAGRVLSTITARAGRTRHSPLNGQAPAAGRRRPPDRAQTRARKVSIRSVRSAVASGS